MTSVSPAMAANPETDAERRRAIRALLRFPLLPAVGETAQDYILVRRHADWLKHWFMKFPAWNFHVDKEVARLRKNPADHLDETRPSIDRTSGAVFSKRRYALLCLALAALERSDRQTTLGRLARSIMELVSADPDLQSAGLVFDIGNYDQRRDLVHAVRYLIDIGLIRRIDGDEREFLERDDSSDVLYDIHRPILAAIMNVSRSPSEVDAATHRSADDSFTKRAAALFDDSLTSAEDSRSDRIRSRLVRALLDDPILYFNDLTSEERTYFEEHRGYLLRQICDATGLIAEIRREGIALVDDSGDLTDLKLPEEGTDGHLTLLLTQWLSEFSRDHAGTAVPVSAVEDHVRSLIQIHGSRWRKEVREAGAETRVTEDALMRLRGLRLIQLTTRGVVPLAACGRYALRDSIDPADNED